MHDIYPITIINGDENITIYDPLAFCEYMDKFFNDKIKNIETLRKAIEKIYYERST